MRFCGQCGAALAPQCPQCGADVPAGFKFCGHCGASVEAATPPAVPGAATGATAGSPSIPAPVVAAPGPTRAVEPTRPGAYTPKHLAEKILKARSALEGERRQVSVLFADLAGFTTLAERRDPEEVHQIIDRCFELITAEVHRFEGTINQYTGDGVMALFGAPIAHEDSPRRAVHAALGIQQALARASEELEASRGVRLGLRIGVNTGPVVVGRIGDDLRMDYTAVGDTTNLAARIQQMARPGGVLVSETTYRLIRDFFEARDLGEVPVKGRAPIRVFEVIRHRGRRARLDAAVERGLNRLVGRDREMGILRDLYRQASAGRGQVAFITGDAGMGKSRLVLELRRALAEAGERVTWLEGRCIAFGQSTPFLPLVDQLRENFGIGEFDGEPEIIAKVEQAMRRMGELDAHIPYIRYLLTVDPGEPGILAMDAAARRRRVFEAARALSIRGALRRPLVLVFEDLHWVDASTEEYLASLMDSVAGVPLMLILTHRIGYAPPFGSRSFYTTVTLQSLSEGEALAIAGQILGSEQYPRELRDALLQKAEGVPLFVEEVTRTLLELGVLQRDNGSYRMVKGIAEVSVPDTIQDIIMARLDRLGDDGKRTVQFAAVIGRQFVRRLLERIADLKDRLGALLEQLTAVEIIYEQPLLAEPAYVFKHAVIQDVAYNSLLVQRRKELHRAVGVAIEELYADRLAEHAEELAHHFVQAEAWPKAFEYLLRSGDRAKDAYANRAAVEFYGRALEAARRMTPPADVGLLMRLHQRRAQVLVSLARYGEAIADCERMLELARGIGDRHGEGEALVEAALAHWLTFTWEGAGRTQRYAEEALALARETGDQLVLARSLTYLGLVDQIHGRLVDGDRKLAQSLRISEPAGFKGVTAQNRIWLGAHANWRGEFRAAIDLSRRGAREAAESHDGFQELMALAFECLALASIGEYAAARAVIETGLAKAKASETGFITGRLTNSLGWLHQEIGDFRRAVELDRESEDIGRRIKNPNVEISATINRAFDHLNLGEPERALALLEETLERVEKFAFGAHRWRWSIHLRVYLGDALLAAGRPEAALAAVERALGEAQATGSRKYLGRCHTLRGQIALGARDFAVATRELGEAVRVAQAIEYRPLLWQAAHLLARAHAGADQPDSAAGAGRLALDALDAVAARIPDGAGRATFEAWPRVEAARTDLARLVR
jgi:class 3 adenylate cyclase/tetratricopeptide (TPR) repeat protein